MAKLSQEELTSLITGGETSQLELKIAPPRPAELAERLCGLANGQGGIIVIGVQDITLLPVGVSDTAGAIDTILRAARLIQPELSLDPAEPEIYPLANNRFLVVATVPPGQGPLYQAGGVCWVRRGTNTIPLSVSEMLELANDRGLLKWELQAALGTTLEDIDPARVEAFLAYRVGTGRQSSRFNNFEQLLVGMRCAVMNRNGQYQPTNAGILFFGRSPQLHLPHSELVCVLYQDEFGIGKYVDRKIIRGTLVELIDGAEAFLHRYIPVGARIEGFKRLDLPDYPVEALREAVVNAVVHRDYSREGESIRLFYYSDRVEIHSPGLLLPGITIEQMERGEVMSKLRNPVLANLLRDVPGYMERLGSGIRLMLYETNRLGLPRPQFRELSEFIVSFRKELLEPKIKPELPANPLSIAPAAPLISEPLAPDAAQVSPKPLLDPEARLQIAMRLVQENGYITNRQLREQTGVSEQTAMRDLEWLVEEGALISVGKTRARRYKLA